MIHWLPHMNIHGCYREHDGYQEHDERHIGRREIRNKKSYHEYQLSHKHRYCKRQSTITIEAKGIYMGK